MAYLTPESETSTTQDLSWTQLIPPAEKKTSVVRIDDKPKEINEETSDDKNPPRRRRESFMDTFNRHLRQSLKAVSESSGQFTR